MSRNRLTHADSIFPTDFIGQDFFDKIKIFQAVLQHPGISFRNGPEKMPNPIRSKKQLEFSMKIIQQRICLHPYIEIMIFKDIASS